MLGTPEKLTRKPILLYRIKYTESKEIETESTNHHPIQTNLDVKTHIDKYTTLPIKRG